MCGRVRMCVVCSIISSRTRRARLLELGGELLVEKMLDRGVVELLLGISYDEQFGHYLVIACGGTLVELVADRQLLLPPVSDEQIRLALGRLGIARLLDGYRGRPAADVNAVIIAVKGLVELLGDQGDQLLEVEINPLIVGAEGMGAVVADALIVCRE